ncbi:MAG: MBL fold metallo-hydrolase [Sphaerochaeta sp.]|jgi:competence protein ComEC|nr:MBL fold metallo-hydrolase [Sphaerochaeta sp.]
MGTTEVTFVNVGYGDAILIGQDGRYGIIDGGSSLAEEFVGNRRSLSDYLRMRGVKTLEFAIITHIHEDHVCGIEAILDEVEIGRFYLPYVLPIADAPDIHLPSSLPFNLRAYAKAYNAYKAILSYAVTNDIPCTNILEVGTINPFDGMTINVLEPRHAQADEYTNALQTLATLTEYEMQRKAVRHLDATSNDHSLVLALESQGYSFLLASDNCPANWQKETFSFVQNGNVLKLPHHGQTDALDDTLLAHLGVDWIVTCSSSDRRNASSHPFVYERLLATKAELKLLFTDEVRYEPFFTEERTNVHALGFLIQDETMNVIV